MSFAKHRIGSIFNYKRVAYRCLTFVASSQHFIGKPNLYRTPCILNRILYWSQFSRINAILTPSVCNTFSRTPCTLFLVFEWWIWRCHRVTIQWKIWRILRASEERKLREMNSCSAYFQAAHFWSLLLVVTSGHFLTSTRSLYVNY